ncbi:MAG: hypothetical protein RBT49_04305 [Bacteroidales bacterium]|nr:hypothetical protein [Bacteroidales bacterium]
MIFKISIILIAIYLLFSLNDFQRYQYVSNKLPLVPTILDTKTGTIYYKRMKTDSTFVIQLINKENNITIK